MSSTEIFKKRRGGAGFLLFPVFRGCKRGRAGERGERERAAVAVVVTVQQQQSLLVNPNRVEAK